MGAFRALVAAMVLSLALASCATGGKRMAAEYYALAEGYAEISKHDKAIAYYRKAARWPAYENASRYGLARSLAMTGDYSGAIEAIEPLLAEDPDNKLVSGAYAFLLAKSGKADEAVALYKRFYDESPDDPRAGRDYAELLVLAGRNQEAIDLVAALKLRFPGAEALKDVDALETRAKAAIEEAAKPAAPDTKPEPKAKKS